MKGEAFMNRIHGSRDPGCLVMATLMSVFALSVLAQGQKDPHRVACADAHCRKVKSFLKTHYCGASPFGNGPDDGCEIKSADKPRAGVTVIADYKCEWSDSKQAAQCEQHGQPSSIVRNTLITELQRLGLPDNASGQTYFEVWKSAHSGWSVGMAYYSRSVGDEVELCEVIVVIDESAHAIVLRKLPLQKTDRDVYTVTQWAPLDVADVYSDGNEEIVLEGDEYENHWLEVVSVRDGTAKTIFSGLGYYL
jgi:hypothetical protein